MCQKVTELHYYSCFIPGLREGTYSGVPCPAYPARVHYPALPTPHTLTAEHVHRRRQCTGGQCTGRTAWALGVPTAWVGKPAWEAWAKTVTVLRAFFAGGKAGEGAGMTRVWIADGQRRL